MSNQISVETQHTIQQLQAQGWSLRRIARELGLHRDTVRSYGHNTSEQGDSNCTTPITGNADENQPKCTTPITGSGGSQASKCDAHHDLIMEKLELGLSVQRIFQDLRAETSFSGSYGSVLRFVQKHKAKEPERVWRMECEPGEEAQIDYGTMYVLEHGTGRPKKAQLLRVTLSHSRKSYSEAMLRQDTESFIRGLENAFRYFGGVPKRLCLDNLKAGVIKADWYEPELNPKLRSFAAHYGTVAMPTRPYKPEHKGKIENGIGYLKNNALKGRRFPSLQALNEHLRDWELNVADKRIHGTTRRHVGTHFEQVEKAALHKLPSDLFPSFQEGKRSVHRDACLKVCHAFYHVPVEYIGAQVWVRWDAAMVRIFNHKMKHIISHARLEPGQFTQVLGVEGCRGSIEESVRYYRGRLAIYGESCARWADLVISENPQGAIRLMQGLLSLADKYECSHLQEACRKAVIHGHYRLGQLRDWLSSPHEQETFSFLEQHEIIRQMQIYGDYSGGSHLFNSN